MKRIYVYPRFSTLGAFGFRGGGPGLGNLFFSYARALLLVKERGYTLINPSWATFKLGTFLRRERDKRLYLRIFKPRGISGPWKTLLLLTRRKVMEDSAKDGVAGSGSIVLTSGLRELFKNIAHEREYLAGEFRKILRAEDVEHINAAGSNYIGVHVRLGDFPESHRTPISWYLKTIIKIRQAAGEDIPVLIASDGSDAELSELLRLPNIKRLNMNSVVDMFSLANSKIILASDSTFSAWAAFLGHVPILWGKRDPSLDGIFVDDTINEVLAADADLPVRIKEYLQRSL